METCINWVDDRAYFSSDDDLKKMTVVCMQLFRKSGLKLFLRGLVI